jgi:hypothetical protein
LRTFKDSSWRFSQRKGGYVRLFKDINWKVLRQGLGYAKGSCENLKDIGLRVLTKGYVCKGWMLWENLQGYQKGYEKVKSLY